jgi:hypothetical protein
MFFLELGKARNEKAHSEGCRNSDLEWRVVHGARDAVGRRSYDFKRRRNSAIIFCPGFRQDIAFARPVKEANVEEGFKRCDLSAYGRWRHAEDFGSFSKAANARRHLKCMQRIERWYGPSQTALIDENSITVSHYEFVCLSQMGEVARRPLFLLPFPLGGISLSADGTLLNSCKATLTKADYFCALQRTFRAIAAVKKKDEIRGS